MKIINDPVHGFIEISHPLILKLIDHPYFQRLRRIHQLGLTFYVYPGAIHTRFLHALGAYHLTQRALNTLHSKGVQLTKEEMLATLIAILLHDIGHGPFSHALEHLLLHDSHENLTQTIMLLLNDQFHGQLQLAIAIFQDQYEKHFLHQLISSQMDMDRLDYLIRDSFFTGVVEGIIGTDRLIQTLHVVDNQIVIEEKGLYSVEKFVIARRLMYWQVYLHKTALAAERMLAFLIRRVRELIQQDRSPNFLPPQLAALLTLDPSHIPDSESIHLYCQLDDYDILYAVKMWSQEADPILHDLSQRLLNRNLFKLYFTDDEERMEQMRQRIQNHYGELWTYYYEIGTISNQAYVCEPQIPILIKKKNGDLLPLHQATDHQFLNALTTPVTRTYLLSAIPMK